MNIYSTLGVAIFIYTATITTLPFPVQVIGLAISAGIMGIGAHVYDKDHRKG